MYFDINRKTDEGFVQSDPRMSAPDREGAGEIVPGLGVLMAAV